MVIKGPKNFNKEETTSAPPLSPFNETVVMDANGIKREGNNEILKLTGMNPGWHLISISRLSKEGDLEAQSRLQIFVHPQSTWWNFWRMPIGIMVIFLLILFLGLHRFGR
jgi:hypothetical protein